MGLMVLGVLRLRHVGSQLAWSGAAVKYLVLAFVRASFRVAVATFFCRQMYFAFVGVRGRSPLFLHRSQVISYYYLGSWMCCAIFTHNSTQFFPLGRSPEGLPRSAPKAHGFPGEEKVRSTPPPQSVLLPREPTVLCHLSIVSHDARFVVSPAQAFPPSWSEDFSRPFGTCPCNASSCGTEPCS